MGLRLLVPFVPSVPFLPSLPRFIPNRIDVVVGQQAFPSLRRILKRNTKGGSDPSASPSDRKGPPAGAPELQPLSPGTCSMTPSHDDSRGERSSATPVIPR